MMKRSFNFQEIFDERNKTALNLKKISLYFSGIDDSGTCHLYRFADRLCHCRAASRYGSPLRYRSDVAVFLHFRLYCGGYQRGRDEGKAFALTDEDAKADSILQYIVANELSAAQNKVYITTTGYNRNELFFKKT